MNKEQSPEAYELWRKAVVESQGFALPENWTDSRERVDGIAIDADSTCERDDAVWFMPDGAGGFEVTVSIADVGSFVAPGSAVADHAAYVGQTRYLKNLRRPMLPRRIGQHTLSLSDNRHGPALALHARLNADYDVVDAEVYQGVIRPMRVSYDQVAAFTNRDDDDDPRVGIFKAYESFALQLLKKRQAEGALVLIDTAAGVVTDEEGHVVQLEAGSEYAGRLIAQEFAILANAVFAEYRRRRDIPGLSRQYLMPQRLGIIEATSLVRKSEIEQLQITPADLGRAFYASRPGPHAALNLPQYDHDTSPLRRFADLVNHWNILAHLQERDYPVTGELLEEIAAHLNGVEDDVRTYWQDYREQIATQAEGRLSGEVTVLQGLSFNEFDQVFQAAVRRGEAPEGFQAAVEQKLAQNALRPKDFVEVIFASHQHESWLTLREKLITHLAGQPALAANVLNLAKSRKLVDDVTAVSSAVTEMYEWKVAIEKDGERYVGTRRGASSEDARNKASVQALLRLAGLNMLEDAEEPQPDQPEQLPVRHPKSVLLEYAQAEGLELSKYGIGREIINGTDIAYTATVYVGDKKFVGVGWRQRDAEADAAAIAIEALQIEDKNPEAGLKGVIVSPVTLLHQYALENDKPVPRFRYRRKGKAGSPTFYCEVTVVDAEGVPLTFTGLGPNKVMAKRNAALYANNVLKGTPTDELDSRGAVS